MKKVVLFPIHKLLLCHITGVEIRFCHLGASRAPTIGNLGALIRIWGPRFILYLIKNLETLIS